MRSDLIRHCKIWRKYSWNTSLKENRGTFVCLDQWSSYLTELRSSGNLCNLTHIGGEAPPKVIQQIGLVSTIIIILFHLHGSHQCWFVYQNFSTFNLAPDWGMCAISYQYYHQNEDKNCVPPPFGAGRVLVPSLFSRSSPSTFDLPVANCFLVAKGRMMKDTGFLFVLISKYLLRNWLN